MSEQFDEVIKDAREKFPNFFRLSIANFMDSTNGYCDICKHKYIDVDDCIEKNIILLKRDNSLEKTNIISCKECYENR